MASTIKENGCICGGDLFLKEIKKVAGLVFVYNCSKTKCNTVAFLKDQRKKYNHIRLEVKQDG